MKFYRNAIILLAVFIALTVVYLYLPQQSEDKETEDKKITLKSFSKDQLTQIDIQNQNGSLTLTKNGSDWMISKPKEYKLDRVSTDSFINSLVDLKAESVVEENAQDLDKYGLKTPKSTVGVKTSDGITTVFMLGNESPIGGGYYLKTLDSNTVYIVDSYKAGDFLRSISEFRDKAVFELKPEDVTTLTLIKQEKQTLKFVKTTEWEVSTPDGNKTGNQEEISNVIDKVVILKVKDFVVDDPGTDFSKYGLDKPSYVISINFKDKPEEKLIVGKDTGEESIYIRKSSSVEVFTVDKQDINFIDKDPKEFEQK